MAEMNSEIPKRIRVAVLFGGQSSEHSISCVSAGSIFRALDPERYEVVPIGITSDGQWVQVQVDLDQLVLDSDHMPEVNLGGAAVALRTGGDSVVLTDLSGVPLGSVDVVFPVLHGPWGEDGTIQGLLELAGVPYVGSGVFASAAAMDKGHLKHLAAAHGIAAGSFEVVTDRQWQADRAACITRCIDLLKFEGGALFVKPARAGSSVGITRVGDPADLEAAIEFARQHDPKVIVELAVENAREIECGVLVVDGIARASVCAEIAMRPGRDWYDFEAKYLDDAVDLMVPADLPPEVVAQVQQLAVRAFEAVDGEGLARVDFFVRPNGDVVLNEINTMPGFTSISMYPRMWAESGIDYPTLIDLLIADALRRGTGLR